VKRYAGLTQWLMPLLANRYHTLTGLENIPASGPYILAGNHVGSPDPMAVMAAVYRHTRRAVVFVAYDNVVRAFGKKLAYNWLAIVEKVENRPNECLDVLRRELENGQPVGIFPEGMRNAASFLLPGKTGVARLAHWTGAPVIPFGFTGPSTWTFGQGFRATLSLRRNLALRIGEPLVFPKVPDAEITKALLTQTTRTIMTRIGELAGRPYPY